MFGILLIDKPQGITSHDVVSRLRRTFQTRRVGHAGTLDPLATGLLVIAIGPATRFLQYLPLEPKEYVSVFKFGETTNTFDAEGEITETKPVPSNLEEKLVEVFPDFIGSVQQLPPMYSAVKKDGKPLYAYARKGEEVERQLREVYIDELELDNVTSDTAQVRLVCSGGTYVRTLAHDVGQAVGCGAFVQSLVRTKVGKFTLDQAVKLEDASPDHLIPLTEALPPTPLIELNDTQVVYVRQGRQILIKPLPDSPTVGLLDDERNVVGMGRVIGNKVQPECVIPADALVEASQA